MINILKQRQVFSFLPIKVSIGNQYKMLSTKKSVAFDNKTDYINLSVKMLGLKKKIHFSIPKSNHSDFELYMNIEKSTSYVMLLAILMCFALSGYLFFTDEVGFKLIVFILFPIVYLLRIFHSIHIRPLKKE